MTESYRKVAIMGSTDVSAAAQTQFGSWRWLGPRSGADHCPLRADEIALVLFLEPVSLVVAMPPLPGGELALARFCRILGRTARELAARPRQDIATGDQS